MWLAYNTNYIHVHLLAQISSKHEISYLTKKTINNSCVNKPRLLVIPTVEPHPTASLLTIQPHTHHSTASHSSLYSLTLLTLRLTLHTLQPHTPHPTASHSSLYSLTLHIFYSLTLHTPHPTATHPHHSQNPSWKDSVKASSRLSARKKKSIHSSNFA